MKNLIAVMVAIAAITFVAGQEANAQSFSFNKGYQFGTGVRAAGGFNLGHRGFANQGFGISPFFGRGFVNRPVAPPYFAQFPPVYYSGIVKRPYGISPYAAPAGITPVEMQVPAAPVEPVVISNPYYNKNQNTPVSVMDKTEDSGSTKNKSTRVTNQFFKSVPEVAGPIMHASYDVEGN
jgi:hypothetical protein